MRSFFGRVLMLLSAKGPCVVGVFIIVGVVVHAQDRGTSWREATGSRSWTETEERRDLDPASAAWSPIVARIVRAVLGRAAPVAGLRFWPSRLADGTHAGRLERAARSEWRDLSQRHQEEFRAWQLELKWRLDEILSEVRGERTVPPRGHHCYRPHPECRAWTNGACPYVERTGHHPVLQEECFTAWKEREQDRRSDSVRAEFQVHLREHHRRWKRECDDLSRAYPDHQPRELPFTCAR